MAKAIAMIEFMTVASGVSAADTMVKTSEVDILEANVVCPGKYIILISGDLSAVNAAVESAKNKHSDKLVDSYVLGNPHEAIFPAIYGAVEIESPKALGVVETYSAASIIASADIAAKTADVQLIEIRIAKGMCGKSYLFLTGEVAAVTASVERAKALAGDRAMLLDTSIIANPDEKTWRNII